MKPRLETPYHLKILWHVFLVACLFLKISKVAAEDFECRPPPAYPNLVIYYEKNLSSFPDGSHLTYKCAPGMTEISGSGETVCISDTSGNHWTAPNLICRMVPLNQVKSCGELLKVNNAIPDTRFIRLTYLPGTNVTYNCLPGYQNVKGGSNIASCHQQNPPFWIPPAMICQVVCPLPPAVMNSNPKLVEPPYLNNTAIEYSCNLGYAGSNGTTKALCAVDGLSASWIPPSFKCQARDCGDPGEANNGHKEGDVYTFTHSVNYTCDTGFEMIGFPVLHCLSNGDWSHERPRCKILSCPELLPVENGSLDKVSVQFGAVVKHRCNSGFKLVGSATQKCQADRTWSGTPPACKQVLCDIITYLPGQKMPPLVLDNNRPGGLMLVRCTHVERPMSLKCSDNGLWVPTPYCPVPKTEATTPATTVSPVRCSRSLTNLTLGGYNITGTKVNSTVNYWCHPGYSLKGSSSGICQENGKWLIKLPPTCSKGVSLVVLLCSIGGSVVALILLGWGGFFLYRRYHKPSPGYKNKAPFRDATHWEETSHLDRSKRGKKIPTTVL